MSFRPLVLYDPDSDDSSSDGGSVGGRNHASMGIANDGKRDNDSDRFSLQSGLFEVVSDDEMDDPMLRSRHYNPSNLRVEMGKRVGVDSGDESDGDGEHYGEDKDFSSPTKNTHLRVSGDIDEHSVGSDDEFHTAHSTNFPKRITRNDKELDDLMPTGNALQETVGGAGEPADAFAEAEVKGKQAVEKAEKRLSTKRLESKRIVAEALAKAKALKGKTDTGSKVAVQFYEGKARQVGKGNVAGATLTSAVKEKGKEVLTKLGKNLKLAKALEQGKLAEKFSETQKKEIAEAKTRKAKAGALSKIKLAGKSGEGEVVKAVGRGEMKTVKGKTSSLLQASLKPVERAMKKVDKEAGLQGRALQISKMVSTRLKTKALVTLLASVKTVKAKREAGKKILEALKTNLAKTKAEEDLVKRLIAEKMMRERLDKGGGESVVSEVGKPKTMVTEGTSDPSAEEKGRVELTAGNILELRPYGKQVRIFLNSEELKASASATAEDKAFLESLIEQIKSKYGRTAYPEIRKKLGDRAIAIGKKLNKK